MFGNILIAIYLEVDCVVEVGRGEGQADDGNEDRAVGDVIAAEHRQKDVIMVDAQPTCEQAVGDRHQATHLKGVRSNKEAVPAEVQSLAIAIPSFNDSPDAVVVNLP